MKDVKKALLLLTRSLLVRLRIDLVSTENGVKHDPRVTQDGANLVQWLARPQTLRLSTRPRLPPKFDGSRSGPSNRISKSCDMPSIAFDDLNSIDRLAEKIVHNNLVPLFYKIHPEKSVWDLSLINICATNMLQLASDKQDGAGRDISRMFKNQKEVRKERNFQDDGFSHGTRFQADKGGISDLTSPMTGAIVSRKTSHDDWKNDQMFIQDDHIDEAASNKEEETSSDGKVCMICGTSMPLFAILAHKRFHSMSD